jgi:hypothetical protein
MAFSLLLCLALLPGPARATPADSLRPTGAPRRLACTYANDLFLGTDYYFTQGIALDWVSPALARGPARWLLPRGPAGSTRYHGLALRYDGFTPLSIADSRIRRGDRPYAAYLYVSAYRISNQEAKKQRFTTAFDVGFIGPAAGGKPIQTKLHEWTGATLPRGWDYQVRSDVVLGYRAFYEKQLLAAGGLVELIGTAEASLGTLYTYAGAGGKLRIGWFAPYFSSLDAAAATRPASSRRWQCYGQATLEGRLVGYDATLQGGLFNHSSPYTLAASSVRPAVLRGAGSLVVAHNGLSFTATATYLGPEFAGGRPHRWGTLGLARVF